MKFNELTIQSHKKSRRVGRGISAGQGKTAGRGTKGQGSRTGGGKGPHFEGGQTPLMQRLPKMRGFRAIKAKPTTVTTAQIGQVKGTVVDGFTLAEAGVIEHAHLRIKLVLRGEVTKKLIVKLPAASDGAIKAVEKAGGSFAKVPRNKRISAKKSEPST